VRFGMLSKERVSAEARPGLAGFQHPIDRRPADLDCLCDLRRPQPLRLHCAHLSNDYRDRPAFVDACGKLWSSQARHFAFGTNDVHVSDLASLILHFAKALGQRIHRRPVI
jgi:hypothetical protein